MTDSTDKASEDRPASTAGQSGGGKDPLHGVKLEQILNELVDELGWKALAEQVPVNCFKSNPSVKSSLKFLRKTPWARQKVESLYLRIKGFSANKRATKTPRALEAEQGYDRYRNKDHKPRNTSDTSRDTLSFSRDKNSGRDQGAHSKRHKSDKRHEPRSTGGNPWANARPGGNKED